MVICVAVDDNMGMTFNKRRQSKDCVLREKLMELVGDGKLWINTYTSNQFDLLPAKNIIVDDDLLNKAGKCDLCFIENLSAINYIDKIEKIYLFKWNRIYPADFYFDIPLNEGWKLISKLDFEGNSHKNITQEEWIK